MSCGHSWKDTTESAWPAETARKGCGGEKDLALFSPVGKKVEVMLWEGPRKSLFLVEQGKREPSWGLGGGWVGGDLRRENLVLYRGKFRKPTPVAAVSSWVGRRRGRKGAPGRWIRECQERSGWVVRRLRYSRKDRVDGKDLEC